MGNIVQNCEPLPYLSILFLNHSFYQIRMIIMMYILVTEVTEMNLVIDRFVGNAIIYIYI